MRIANSDRKLKCFDPPSDWSLSQNMRSAKKETMHLKSHQMQPLNIQSRCKNSNENQNPGNWMPKKVLAKPNWSKTKQLRFWKKKDMNWPLNYSKNPTRTYRIAPVSIWMLLNIVKMYWITKQNFNLDNNLNCFFVDSEYSVEKWCWWRTAES